MSDQTPPHLSDHGEHQLPDATHTTPAARAMFGWTTRPWAGTAVFWGLLVLSAILVLLEPALEAMTDGDHHFRHAYFSIDAFTAFHAWWGFGAFTLMVLAGWPLGRLMRRREDYYDDEHEPAGTEPNP
jgi:hypothetical protein